MLTEGTKCNMVLIPDRAAERNTAWTCKADGPITYRSEGRRKKLGGIGSDQSHICSRITAMLA